MLSVFIWVFNSYSITKLAIQCDVLSKSLSQQHSNVPLNHWSNELSSWYVGTCVRWIGGPGTVTQRSTIISWSQKTKKYIQDWFILWPKPKFCSSKFLSSRQPYILSWSPASMECSLAIRSWSPGMGLVQIWNTLHNSTFKTRLNNHTNKRWLTKYLLYQTLCKAPLCKITFELFIHQPSERFPEPSHIPQEMASPYFIHKRKPLSCWISLFLNISEAWFVPFDNSFYPHFTCF